LTEAKGLLLKYFVLNPSSRYPDHRDAARAAIHTYAAFMEDHDPELAHQLRVWMRELKEKD